MGLQRNATIEANHDSHIALLNCSDARFEQIAGAQAFGTTRSEKDVAGAQADTNAIADTSAAKRHFEFG